MSKNYLYRSTQESRDNSTSSVLAIVETIFFVILTWGMVFLAWHLVVLTNQHVLPELPKLFGML